MISNNHLKILSVVFAVFLWIIVVMGQIETKTISVPVNLVNAPENYVAVTSVPSVSVTIQGSANVLANMNYSSIILNMDTESLPVGDSLRRILPSDFTTRIGIEVIKVQPEEINITIDKIATKKIKVVPTFIGDVALGFKVDSVSTRPDSVEIQGARSKLKEISFISTLPVNLSGVKESSAFNIGFKDEDGVKMIQPESVEVRVRMKPDIIIKDIKNIPVTCMNLPKGFSMKEESKLSNVKVEGRADLVDLFPSKTMFVVNCAEITAPGKYSREVAYKTTVEGVNVKSITPQKISFEIVK